MATVQQRGDSFRIQFLYHGKRHGFTLGSVTEAEANSKAAQVDYLLMRLKQRLAAIPPGVSVIDYVQFDGKPAPADSIKTTLAQLRDKYIATNETSLEPSTVSGIRLHFKHLVGYLGPAFPIGELCLSDLQQYADKRAKANLSPATIKKEIVTLRTAWNWGVPMKLVSGKFPAKGLRYPKADEKPPFMTRQEINRRIPGLSQDAQADLWHALYLTVDELPRFLSYVKENARHPFIYPAVCFLAHTGARRSELLRARIEDVDEQITLREKKRVQGRNTTRRVPVTPTLAQALKEWLAIHPGGPYLFCHAAIVGRSRKRSAMTGFKGKTRAKTVAGRLATVKQRDSVSVSQLTKDEFNDHFGRTLADSEWEHVTPHALRHSFISACAAKGIDQRVIDDFVGHQTDEQRNRYRHLYPTVKQQAIRTVFG